MKAYLVQKIYLGLGIASLILGFIGIFLPIWPTTPFLIVAAWAMQKGSPKIHKWLVSHPVIGPPIIQWQNHRVISKKAKIISTTLITCSFIWVLLTRPLSIALKVIMVVFAISIITFIITRSSRPPHS